MGIQDLFERGLSFMEFVNQDKDTHKEKTLDLYHSIVIEDELESQIKSIHRKVNVLVFAEIWCPDCMINVPALQKIVDINPNFNISIVSREGNESYMEDYKVNGKPKIPTFLFLDDHFNLLGAFIEQPQVVRAIEAKGKQVEIIVAKRKYRKGEYMIETIQEMMNML